MVISNTNARGGRRGTTIIVRGDGASADHGPAPVGAVEDSELAATAANPYLDGTAVDSAPGANPFNPLVIESSPATLASGGVQPAPSLRQASQPDQSVAAATHVQPRPQWQHQRGRPRVRIGAIVRMLVKLIVVLALLAGAGYAGYVYLWPMIAPNAWNETAEPYAAALEEVIGDEFDAAIDVVAESPAVYEARAGDTIFGNWKAQLPTWRALALVDGPVDRNALDRALVGWDPALYAAGEQVVYHDQSLGGSLYDADITRQLALAYLDQVTHWSDAVRRAGLDERAVHAGQAYADAAALQRATPYSTPIPAPSLGALGGLPPVLAYEMMAPLVFAELQGRSGPEVAAALAVAVRRVGCDRTVQRAVRGRTRVGAGRPGHGSGTAADEHGGRTGTAIGDRSLPVHPAAGRRSAGTDDLRRRCRRDGPDVGSGDVVPRVRGVHRRSDCVGRKPAGGGFDGRSPRGRWRLCVRHDRRCGRRCHRRSRSGVATLGSSSAERAPGRGDDPR